MVFVSFFPFSVRFFWIGDTLRCSPHHEVAGEVCEAVQEFVQRVTNDQDQPVLA